MQTRHGWSVRPEWLLKTPGVVFAIALAVKACTRPPQALEQLEQAVKSKPSAPNQGRLSEDGACQNPG